MKKQRENMTPCILGFLCIITRFHCRVASTGYRSNKLIVRICNKCIPLSNRLGVAPPAFFEVEAAVYG